MEKSKRYAARIAAAVMALALGWGFTAISTGWAADVAPASSEQVRKVESVYEDDGQPEPVAGGSFESVKHLGDTITDTTLTKDGFVATGWGDVQDGAYAKLPYGSPAGADPDRADIAEVWSNLWVDLDVEANTDYRVTFDAFLWNPDDRGVLQIGLRNPYAANVWDNVWVKQMRSSEFGTQSATYDFVVNTGALTTVRLAFFTQGLTEPFQNGAGEPTFQAFCIDNVMLNKVNRREVGYEVSTEARSLVKNGNFSENFPELADGALLSEDNWTGLPWAGIIDGVRWGKLTYRFNGLNAGQKSGIYQDIRVTPNTTYLVTFSACLWNLDDRHALKLGFCNSRGANAWAPVTEYTLATAELGTEMCQFQAYLNTGDMDLVRLFFYTQSVAHEGTDNGINLNDISLKRITGAAYEVESAALVSDKSSVMLGETADLYVLMSYREAAGLTAALPFSELTDMVCGAVDETVFRADAGTHTAEALREGQTNIFATFTYRGKSYAASALTLTAEAPYHIASVELSIPKTMELLEETELSIGTIRLDNGTVVPAEECTFALYSSNPKVVKLLPRGEKYCLYALGGGSAEVYYTLRYQRVEYVSDPIEVTVEAGANAVVNGSFEAGSGKSADGWTIVTKAGYGVDSGQGLSHTGQNNLWFMAPCHVEEGASATDTVLVYQDAELTAGQYTLTAVINRFIARSKEGDLPGFGGDVYIGALPLGGIEPVENDYTENATKHGVSYGLGGYGEVRHLFEAAEAGTFRVYLFIAGDPVNGLGMQVDDIALAETVLPVSVAVTPEKTELTVEDVIKLETVVTYADGSTGAPERVEYAVSDESVAHADSGFVRAKAAGTVTITVTVTDRGVTLTQTVTLTVKEEAGEQENPPAGCGCGTLFFAGPGMGGSIALLALGALALLFIRARNRKRI